LTTPGIAGGSQGPPEPKIETIKSHDVMAATQRPMRRTTPAPRTMAVAGVELSQRSPTMKTHNCWQSLGLCLWLPATHRLPTRRKATPDPPHDTHWFRRQRVRPDRRS